MASEIAPASPEQPVYRRLHQGNDGATKLFMITCDEGWRSSIVCTDMYDWAAEWLVGVLGRKPYVPGARPGSPEAVAAAKSQPDIPAAE